MARVQVYMQDILHREDAPCYPPYMQGLGYVLSRDLVQVRSPAVSPAPPSAASRLLPPSLTFPRSDGSPRDLVQLLGSIAPSLKVYTNEDMMVGTWLVGHHVNRARLVARQVRSPADLPPSPPFSDRP